jgi:hypothetical protein
VCLAFWEDFFRSLCPSPKEGLYLFPINMSIKAIHVTFFAYWYKTTHLDRGGDLLPPVTLPKTVVSRLFVNNSSGEESETNARRRSFFKKYGSEMSLQENSHLQKFAQDITELQCEGDSPVDKLRGPEDKSRVIHMSNNALAVASYESSGDETSQVPLSGVTQPRAMHSSQCIAPPLSPMHRASILICKTPGFYVCTCTKNLCS